MLFLSKVFYICSSNETDKLMSIFDFFVILILVVGFIKGASKGFVLEFSGFIGIIVGIYISRFYSGPMTEMLVKVFGVEKEYSVIFGFALTFVFAMLLFSFLARLVNKFVTLISLGWLNKLLGGVFSLFKYMFIISVCLNIFGYFNQKVDFVPKDKLDAYLTYNPVKAVVPAVLPYLNLNELLDVIKNGKQ